MLAKRLLRSNPRTYTCSNLPLSEAHCSVYSLAQLISGWNGSWIFEVVYDTKSPGYHLPNPRQLPNRSYGEVGKTTGHVTVLIQNVTKGV